MYRLSVHLHHDCGNASVRFRGTFQKRSKLQIAIKSSGSATVCEVRHIILLPNERQKMADPSTADVQAELKEYLNSKNINRWA